MSTVQDPVFFQLHEFLNSETAKKNNIKLIPSFQVVENLRVLSIKVLDPVRRLIEKPMIITSGYRNPKLNKLVNGAASSQHLIGEAADFKLKDNYNLRQVYNLVQASNIPYDQMIYYPNKGIIHLSYTATRKPRRQAFIK